MKPGRRKKPAPGATSAPQSDDRPSPASGVRLAFSVEGNPIPTARARVVTSHGRTWAYTPKNTKDYQQAVEFYARNAMRLWDRGTFPLSGNIRLTVRFVRDSWRRADLDNLTKGVKDACTAAGVWEDDSQVCEAHLFKGISVLEPRTEITIERVLWPKP